MKGINLYHEVPAGTPEEFNVVVDIPRGSSNKYEYDEEGGYFKLDRTVHHQMFFPFDYGFIPQTHAGDGDATDVCLLLTYPTFSGCVVKARPIGMVKTSDQDGDDAKIIAVPVGKLDPRFDEIKKIEDLPKHSQEELLIFFKEVKKLEKAKYDKVTIHGFGNVKEAMAEIKASMEAYKKKHS
jgi:inorganic pyrophosphatase